MHENFRLHCVVDPLVGSDLCLLLLCLPLSGFWCADACFKFLVSCYLHIEVDTRPVYFVVNEKGTLL